MKYFLWNLIKFLIITKILKIFVYVASLSNSNFGNCETENQIKGYYKPINDCPTLLDSLSALYQNNIFLSNAIRCCPDEQIHDTLELFPREPICGSILLKRIVGGTNTSIDEFPWTVRIKYVDSKGQKLFLCGGSLISSRWILTAAHCVTGRDLDGVKLIGVRLGEWNIATDPDCDIDSRGKRDCAPRHIDVDVDRILPHEDFDKIRRFSNDIALLRLVYPVNFSDFVKPICLPIESRLRSDNELINKIVEVAGWGSTGTNEPNSLIKHKAIINVRPLEICQRSYASWHLKLDNTQMCAGGQIGIDTCLGDSGGPAMAETLNKERITYYYIAGIVSFGKRNCGETEDPAVYTRVGAYIDWIINKIRENI